MIPNLQNVDEWITNYPSWRNSGQRQTCHFNVDVVSMSVLSAWLMPLWLFLPFHPALFLLARLIGFFCFFSSPLGFPSNLLVPSDSALFAPLSSLPTTLGFSPFPQLPLSHLALFRLTHASFKPLGSFFSPTSRHMQVNLDDNYASPSVP